MVEWGSRFSIFMDRFPFLVNRIAEMAMRGRELVSAEQKCWPLFGERQLSDRPDQCIKSVGRVAGGRSGEIRSERAELIFELLECADVMNFAALLIQGADRLALVTFPREA